MKTSTAYRVRICYVDDSYWDDGSRYTSQIFKFNKRKDAIEFAKNAMTNGCELYGQNNKVFTKPDKDDIIIYRDTVSEVKW